MLIVFDNDQDLFPNFKRLIKKSINLLCLFSLYNLLMRVDDFVPNLIYLMN